MAFAPAFGILCRLALLAALFADFCRPALAWDKDGHEAIGMTTMSALNPEATAQLKRLMGGKDAVDAAGWALKVNKKFPWTSELHFQRQTAWKCDSLDVSHCPNNVCLVSALKHLYGTLTHKNLVNISWGSGITLTDADHLKYLINLIGDLHQPLHLGFDEGDHGRNITVQFRGRAMSLFDFWDKELTQAVIKDSPGFWWGGWTHVQRTRSEYEKDTVRWKKEGLALFEVWAQESHRFVCEDVYTNPLTHKRIEDEVEGGQFRIDNLLFEKYKQEMLSRMLVAGARTAIVLNAVLATREAANLHGGTMKAIALDDEEEKAKESMLVDNAQDGEKIYDGKAPLIGIQALTMNLGIFVLVFAVFMYVMHMQAGKDGSVAQTAKAKRKGMDSGKVV